MQKIDMANGNVYSRSSRRAQTERRPRTILISLDAFRFVSPSTGDGTLPCIVQTCIRGREDERRSPEFIMQHLFSCNSFDDAKAVAAAATACECVSGEWCGVWLQPWLSSKYLFHLFIFIFSVLLRQHRRKLAFPVACVWRLLCRIRTT